MRNVHSFHPRIPRQPRLLQDPPPRPRLPWRRGRGARGGVPGPEKLVPKQPGGVQVARGGEQGLAGLLPAGEEADGRSSGGSFPPGEGGGIFRQEQEAEKKFIC